MSDVSAGHDAARAASPRRPTGAPPHLADLTLTTLTADRFDDFHRAGERGFQEETPSEHLAAERAVVDPQRFFGFTSTGRWISTFGSVRRVLTVPGGAAVPVSGVTAVTVHSAYRRRGLLRRSMQHEFDLARSRGEIIAALYAAESGIYGRFGYGNAASHVALSGAKTALALRADVKQRLDAAGGSVDEVERDAFVRLVVDLHDRLRRGRPGSLDRPDEWWTVKLSDPPSWRKGATALRFVVSFDATGRIDGHATYRVRGGDDASGNPAGEALIGEVEADTPVGYARLWRYLAGLDLVRTFSVRHAPIDHALQYLVADPRAIANRQEDGLYVRLLDVAAALAARRYAAPLDVVIEVRDDALPAQAGRYRLRTVPEGGARTAGNAAAPAGLAARVSRVDAEAHAPADITVSARDLGAAYLGETSLGSLHAAGLVDEHRPGAVAEAATAFGWPVAPFCADVF